MPTYKYLGEPPRTFVKEYGPTERIEVPRKDGTRQVLYKSGGFPVGQVVTDATGQPVVFSDEFSLLVLDADERFVRATL